MKKNATEDLKQSILDLEKKKTMLLHAMKEEVNDTVESLKPKNLLKSNMDNVFGSGAEVKNELVNTIVGLGTGYVAKKLFIKKESGIKGKIAGTVLQFVVANLIAKNSDTLKDWGKKAIHFLKSKRKEPEHEM